MSLPRTSEVERRTNETSVQLRLVLDGNGHAEINTPVPFLNHMLELLARHGRFDLRLEASGDTHVDDHHTVEDVGIVFGQAFLHALGDKKGITRYGHAYAPMDEALVRTAVDISGRPFFVYEVRVHARRIGSFDVDLAEHFCRSLAFNALITLHVDGIRGENAHHVLEAVFKSLALALHAAVQVTGEELPSTKGIL